MQQEILKMAQENINHSRLKSGVVDMTHRANVEAEFLKGG